MSEKQLAIMLDEARHASRSGPMVLAADVEVLVEEVRRLTAGEENVRKVLVETFVSCIAGIADAAIIAQQIYTVDHVAAGVKQLADRCKALQAAIAEVHAQHADDLCWMPADVNRIFAAAGLPPQDLHVGDKAAMRKNCDRYVDALCAGGDWRSYAELEAEIVRLNRLIDIGFAGSPPPVPIMTLVENLDRLTSALHATKAHPDWAYLVCPRGQFVAAHFEGKVSDGEWEPCPEAEMPGSGDECWRRKVQS